MSIMNYIILVFLLQTLLTRAFVKMQWERRLLKTWYSKTAETRTKSLMLYEPQRFISGSLHTSKLLCLKSSSNLGLESDTLICIAKVDPFFCWILQLPSRLNYRYYWNTYNLRRNTFLMLKLFFCLQNLWFHFS